MIVLVAGSFQSPSPSALVEVHCWALLTLLTPQVRLPRQALLGVPGSGSLHARPRSVLLDARPHLSSGGRGSEGRSQETWGSHCSPSLAVWAFLDQKRTDSRCTPGSQRGAVRGGAAEILTSAFFSGTVIVLPMETFATTATAITVTTTYGTKSSGLKPLR